MRKLLSMYHETSTNNCYLLTQLPLPELPARFSPYSLSGSWYKPFPQLESKCSAHILDSALSPLLHLRGTYVLLYRVCQSCLLVLWLSSHSLSLFVGWFGTVGCWFVGFCVGSDAGSDVGCSVGLGLTVGCFVGFRVGCCVFGSSATVGLLVGFVVGVGLTVGCSVGSCVFGSCAPVGLLVGVFVGIRAGFCDGGFCAFDDCETVGLLVILRVGCSVGFRVGGEGLDEGIVKRCPRFSQLESPLGDENCLKPSMKRAYLPSPKAQQKPSLKRSKIVNRYSPGERQ